VILGLRRQSAAATALLDAVWVRLPGACLTKSGVALRLPPQSKIVTGKESSTSSAAMDAFIPFNLNQPPAR